MVDAMETTKKKPISTKVQIFIAVLIVLTVVVIININKNRDKLEVSSQAQIPQPTATFSPEAYKAQLIKQNEIWLTDASKRYYENHKKTFNDITLEKARETMELCVLDTTMTKENCEGIIEKKFWQGMTKNWAYLSLGAPDRKNTTVIGNTQQEQWVYGDALDGATYLYFTNDTLNSYQKSE